MGYLKYFVILIVASATFCFPSGTEALICKCIGTSTECRAGEQTCKSETKECYTTIGTFIPELGGGFSVFKACNEGRGSTHQVPAEGNDGTCMVAPPPTTNFAKFEICFCNTDLCTVNWHPPTTPTPTTSSTENGNRNRNGIVLRSWSWIPLSIFASSVIIVLTFVGGH